MTQAEQTRLREFSQKMRDEGSAGFADGPWDETAIENDNGLSARQRQHRNWAMKGPRKTRTFGEGVLTWVTILTLITLTAGVIGAWLSYQPEPEVTVTRTDRLNKTPSLERVESRLTRMERRLSHILDPYIRMLNNLSGELDDTRKQLIEHIQSSGQQQVTTTGFEERLGQVEQRLAGADDRMNSLTAMLGTLAESTPVSMPDTAQTAPRMTLSTTDAVASDESVHPPQAPASPAGDTSALTEPEAPVPAPAESADRQADKPLAVAEKTVEPLPVPSALPETGPVAGNTQGSWAINIASYTSEKIAERKLAEMRQQGVDVELVTAEVKDKTIYRARVFGFASRREATAAAVEIKSKLGIEEVWITKR